MKRNLPTVAVICLGLFCGAAVPRAGVAAERIGIEASAAEVGKYEKVEFLIDLKQPYRNAFDPQEVDLRVRLKGPGDEELSVPAFYFQPYERRLVVRGDRQAAWMYPAGGPVWKARFAPPQVGDYEAVAELRDRRGTARSERVRFRCVASSHRGFVRVSRTDPRYFEFAEGEPFFPIGQNLAFIGEAQYVNLAKVEEVFSRLSRHGANYLRVWTCCKDWALAVEARKSAWGRSWHWQPPFVPLPDDGTTPSGRQCVQLTAGDRATLAVSPSHAVALKPRTHYVFAGRVKTETAARVHVQLGPHTWKDPVTGGADGWKAFRLEFESGPDESWLGQTTLRLEGTGSAWVDALSLQEAGGGPELLWEADVNRPPRGFYNPVDCFMLDEIVAAAEQHGIYLQLCLITRDLYMDALKEEGSPAYQQAIHDAKNLLRYAVARWGYSTSVAAWEYFNEMDPGLPTDRFYAELGEYLEQIDVYRHLRSTSTWHPSPRDCRHAKLDVADVHYYLRPTEYQRYRDEVEAVLGQARFLRQHAPDKPALIGEFGLANDRWQPTQEMNDSEQLVDFHNAMWASALSGASGTALFWWWDRLDRREVYPLYRPLASYLADVPWTGAGLREATANVSDRQLRLVGLQGGDRAYLWLFDPRAAWSHVVIRKQAPPQVDKVSVELSGLADGAYRVQCWDTWQGKVVQETSVSASAGVLRFAVPPFRRDIACKIVPSSRLALRPAGKEEYHFDTGILRGTLRPGGRSAGLSSVVHAPSGVPLAGAYGIFSHYRVFTTDARYGHAAWDWPSSSKLLPDGAVEVRWAPAKDHPFEMTAIYRFRGPATLDLETIVKPQKDLPRFEVFLASYFTQGFSSSLVYVNESPEAGGKPAFLPARQSFGHWQMFPRDPQAAQIIADGRWRHEPNPVQWVIMPSMAAPIGVRRDGKTGLAAVVMAHPKDCFAVATPYGTEGHYSLYLSLFGRTVKAGETARARARLVIGPELSDQQAIELYQTYLEEQKR